LQDNEIPAEAKHVPEPGDWRLTVRAEDRGGNVVPIYVVVDPKGEDQGHAEGAPVALADWAGASPATLKAAAVDATPKITDLLRDIEAARMRSDPHSLYNRPAKVFVPPVTGAPGDGNDSLTVQMRRELVKHGEVVQETASGVDFTVAGHVNAVPIAGGQLRVEIQWRMSDASGHDLGMVLQLNEVPPDTVTGYWGDVALAVAQEAAGGVHETLMKDSGHRATETKPAAQTSTQAAPVSTQAPPSPAASGPVASVPLPKPSDAPKSAVSPPPVASVPIPPTARIAGAPQAIAASAPRPAVPPQSAVPARAEAVATTPTGELVPSTHQGGAAPAAAESRPQPAPKPAEHGWLDSILPDW
jgi:hypothetical protein